MARARGPVELNKGKTAEITETLFPGSRSRVGELAFQLREQVHQTETQFSQFSSDPFRMHHPHVGE